MGVLGEWWARQSATRKLVVVALAVEPAKRIIGWLFDRAATLGYEKLLESFFAEERAAAMSAAIRDAMLRAEAWLSDPYISGMVSGAFLLALVMLVPPAYRWLMRSSKRPAVKTDHRLPQTGSRAPGSCTYPAFIPQEAQAGDHTPIIVSEVSRFLTNDIGSLIETGRRVVDWPSVLYSEGADGLLRGRLETPLRLDGRAEV